MRLCNLLDIQRTATIQNLPRPDSRVSLAAPALTCSRTAQATFAVLLLALVLVASVEGTFKHI